MFDYIDDNHSGSISYGEFKKAFDQREETKDDALQGVRVSP